MVAAYIKDMGKGSSCFLPACPQSYWWVHIPCCWGIPSLALESTHGLNNYWSLGLSVGRQPFLTSWTTACKPRSFMYTYIHIQSISSIPLENFKGESCLTTDPFRKTLIYKLDKHPSTYKQQSAYWHLSHWINMNFKSIFLLHFEAGSHYVVLSGLWEHVFVSHTPMAQQINRHQGKLYASHTPPWGSSSLFNTTAEESPLMTSRKKSAGLLYGSHW